jgi:hypothetical protein
VDALRVQPAFQMGEMKFPEGKIGDSVSKSQDWLGQHMGQIESKPAPPPAQPAANPGGPLPDASKKLGLSPEVRSPARPAPPVPPRIPLPPPMRPQMRFKRGR